MKKLEKPILAEGEATGHAHVLVDDSVDVFEDGDSRLFGLSKKTDLMHEEHGKITIPPGEYESGKVIEYDHFSEEARKVID